MSAAAGENSQNVPVIAIDGPSASGKGTVARLVASELGWRTLDSGALYRLVAYDAFQKKVATDDTVGLTLLAENLDVQFGADEQGEERIVLHGAVVTNAIRSEIAGDAASLVAAIPQVREALLERQRRFCEPPGLVADGRDMGTVVFPNAALKIFLTATAEARANRRYKQLMEKGISGNLADLFNEISSRDQRDSQRATAPLKPAADAIEIDTTELTIEQVVRQVISLYQDRSTEH